MDVIEVCPRWRYCSRCWTTYNGCLCEDRMIYGSEILNNPAVYCEFVTATGWTPIEQKREYIQSAASIHKWSQRKLLSIRRRQAESCLP
jgi:hypothetical protein